MLKFRHKKKTTLPSGCLPTTFAYLTALINQQLALQFSVIQTANGDQEITVTIIPILAEKDTKKENLVQPQK